MKQQVIFAVTLLLLSFSCGRKSDTAVKQTQKEEQLQQYIPIDKGFGEFISAYTSGVVPVNSVIEIRLTDEFASKANMGKTSGLFVFDPAIKGKTEWSDSSTLVFRPSELLEPGTVYTGAFNLYKLGETPDRLKIFPVKIQTVKKDFSVALFPPEVTGDDGLLYIVSGEVLTSDFIESNEVENYVSARLDNRGVELVWDHSSGANLHKFAVEKISRSDKSKTLEIKWDGKRYGVRQKASSSIEIPAAGEFKVISVNAIPGDNQKIEIVFSDPIDDKQELEGLIWFSPQQQITTEIKRNLLTIIPVSSIRGEVSLTIESTVKNKSGKNLAASFTSSYDFTQVLPGLSQVGNGVIMPAEGNLIFPFRAANLKAVDLTIVKIFENNLPYFLQQSDLGGMSGMRRFGRPVFKGKIDLSSVPSVNTNKWNLYTIDLSDYIAVEPGVLYRVQIGMRKSYSLYPCKGSDEPGKYEEILNAAEASGDSFWDDPDSYYDDSESYYYYDYAYNWRERDDPCSESYFSPDKRITRNILASNLGLIGKLGSDNKLHVYASDIPTADPVNGVKIDVYDYQLQVIGSGETSSEGSIEIFCPRAPFLVIASKDKDRNYLKVNDGSSLSLSSFDVAGVTPEKGIKAFVYGERDVWRPGDSVFLSLLLRDMTGNMPTGHPVQFELINPLGQRVDNQVQNLPTSGLMVFTTGTSPDAVTGNYNAIFRIGGASFSKRVRVETIKPNRLKIELKFENDLLGGGNESEKGTIAVKWMNGAVARNLNSSIEFLFRPTKTRFEKYSQYEFDDPSVKYSYETTSVFDGNIDENGTAFFNFSPELAGAPGMLNAVFTARVFEQGGDASIIQKSFRYAPFETYAGINFPALKGKERMLFTDADNELKVVTVDEEGKPVSENVEITLYKISYRWWWESDDEDLGNYVTNEDYQPYLSEKIRTRNGEGSYKINIPKGDWGRYLVRATTSSGHSSGKIILIDWPYDYGMKEGSSGATVLSVGTDKEKYNTGETIKIAFAAPENARAIITLENSTGIVEEMRVNTTGASTVVNMKAKPEMAPNVYAYVTVIQPHSQTVNDMPVRMYGVTPILVEDPGTHLSPEIISPDEIRSSQPMVIKVKEANGRPMTYTVAVVDEGLLDITGFRTPDPWSYFYAREALGVKTWDLYNYVIGAFGGTLERVFEIGGDDAGEDKSEGRAKRFIPVVKFLGPFTLGQGKSNTHSIALPQYTGSVRTMVIAGNERSFGAAEKSVFVRDPLMILATAPRVLSPGEKVSLPITVFVQKEGIQEVTVTAEGNDLIRFENATASLSFKEPGEQDIDLLFVAAERTGKATIKVTARSGNETAVYNMEIQVRQPNPAETRTELKILKPGEKWQTVITPFGLEGTNNSSIEASLLPSVNLDKRISWLIDYPHGCSEQITSGAFPQLWLGDVAELDDYGLAQTQKNIRAAVSKLVTRQMGNGGIALWPGSSEPDSWVTSYAGHFIAEAAKKGYAVPDGFRQKWVNYQKNTARNWRYDPNYIYTSNDQAYRLFSLAVSGEAEKASMNRLREAGKLPKLARWLLAASYAITGREEVARELLDVRSTDSDIDYWDYYYGSQLRDRAIALYTLTLLKDTETALPVLKDLCAELSGNGWYSTQSVSWGLMAYSKFAASVSGSGSNEAVIEITSAGGKSEIKLAKGKMSVKDLKVVQQGNPVTLENKSQSTLYATIIRKGVPLKADATREEKGLSVKLEYTSMDFKPINQASLTQGTDFMMVIRVVNTSMRRIDNVALSAMVPSGWEIRNTRLFEAETGIIESTYDYRDIRDDRVYTYFSLNPSQEKKFVMILNASYKGEYFQPALLVEAMYTENYMARIPGGIVKVTGGEVE